MRSIGDSLPLRSVRVALRMTFSTAQVHVKPRPLNKEACKTLTEISCFCTVISFCIFLFSHLFQCQLALQLQFTLNWPEFFWKFH